MNRMLNPKMKSRHIASVLRQKIRSRKLPPGTPLPSAHDLAVQFKVCMMTANRALDMLEQESLIVRRKGSGNFVQKNVIHGRKLILGITDMFQYPDDPARNILLGVFPENAIACFKKENCDYRIISYQDFRNHNIDALAGFNGLLVSITYIDPISEPIIRSLKIPVVLYMAEYEMDFPFPQVIPDHSSAMDQLFTLAKQEKIREIIIFYHPHRNGIARCKAFEFYAKKHHFSESQIRSIEFFHFGLRQKVMELLPELRGKLVITCSDLITCELIQICSENGFACGQDYQLVSYDNLSKTMQLPPGIPEITSIDYSRTAAAKTAAKLLIRSALNPSSVSYQIIKIPTRLMIRESAFQSRKELVSI